MLKQTIQLMIKALIIGALVNFGLQQVPAPLPTSNENTTQHQPPPLQQPPADSQVGLLDEGGD